MILIFGRLIGSGAHIVQEILPIMYKIFNIFRIDRRGLTKMDPADKVAMRGAGSTKRPPVRSIFFGFCVILIKNELLYILT